MSIDRRLLDILCCPVSKSPLKPLSKDQLRWLNETIGAGGVAYIDGRAVTIGLTDGLITEDGKVLYRIEDDIPVLLPEEGIGTTQLESFPG